MNLIKENKENKENSTNIFQWYKLLNNLYKVQSHLTAKNNLSK